MTVFTRTWNAAYEAQPADTENISLGASRIRNLKADIQERLEVDHFHAGNAQDGEHKKITLGAPIATPANVANKAFIYGKDIGGKIELHYLDEDGNEVQITAAGAVTPFAAGTSMLFYQSAAPVGWTKDVATLDNHALRVVSTTAWSGGSNGATGFSSVFGSSKVAGSTTLTAAQSGVPAHTHPFQQRTATHIGGTAMDGGSFTFGTAGKTTSANSAANAVSSHNHTLSLDLNYINVIRATKD